MTQQPPEQSQPEQSQPERSQPGQSRPEQSRPTEPQGTPHPPPSARPPVDPDHPDRKRSPRRGMCAAVLSLEAVVLGLTTPVMIAVADVSPGVALPIGLGLAVACLFVAGALRAEWAYGLGWAIQVAAVSLGLIVTTMFFLGGVFAALWGTAYFLGTRIERERAAAFAAYDAEVAGAGPPDEPPASSARRAGA